MKSNASAACFDPAGTATSHAPNSPTPGSRSPGIWENSILPTTFDLAGSSIAAIQAGQLMLIAAVPCKRCAETSSALNPAYPGGEYFPSSSMNRSASTAGGELQTARFPSITPPPKAHSSGIKSATTALPGAARITYPYMFSARRAGISRTDPFDRKIAARFRHTEAPNMRRFYTDCGTPRGTSKQNPNPDRAAAGPDPPPCAETTDRRA